MIHILSWGEVTLLYLPRFLMLRIMVKDVLERLIVREMERTLSLSSSLRNLWVM